MLIKFAVRVVMYGKFKMFVITVLILCLTTNNALAELNFPTAGVNCGYKSCHYADPTKLNVHIVPHSHNDVGWLKTVDQYYYGDVNGVQIACVRDIIDSVIDELLKNPERRFIQVETVYFDKWWNYQDDSRKEKVRELVNNGQLEFVGGAWSMNDEATVNYQSIIDQFTLGLRMLNDTFGECARPKVGWQIDPFGHSREMAAIFARMGFDGFFFSRLDWRDMNNRLKTKNAETIWKTSTNFDVKSAYLFTSILYNMYSGPADFCIDKTCYFDRLIIVDDETNPSYNLKTEVNKFAHFVRKQAAHYRSNNIIITMGGDFHYQNASYNFISMDRLINGFRKFQQKYKGKFINLFYSTPSCYLKAVNEAGLKYSVKEDDFLPYATDYHSYWTGFYTSRPTSKRYERQGNNLLQILKQLTSFREGEGDATLLKQIMGVMQHHDAITGTEKNHVWLDYHRLLHKAVVNSIESAGNIILKLISANADTEVHKLTTCLLANMTICPQSNQDKFLAIIYNPLSRKVSDYVRLPVSSTAFEIKDLSSDVLVDYQVAKAPRDFSYTRLDVSKCELVFYASDLSPLGFKVYEITNLNSFDELKPVEGDEKYTLQNDVFTLKLDKRTGKLNKIIFYETSCFISQELMYYHGYHEESYYDSFVQASGAYIFRPSPFKSSDEQQPAVSVTNSVIIQTYKGKLFEEVHQHFNEWLTQVIRIYKLGNAEHVEFDWIVGPMDTTDYRGKEVISRFTTSLNTNDTFYTDSNGREILKRRRNHRSDYKYTNEEPVAGNYYPVTSRITLKDEAKNIQLSLLNDRAQGGTSLKSGQVELMLHRNTIKDDGFGVGENLHEMEFDQGLVVRGQLYLTLGFIDGKKKAAVTERDLAQRKLLAPWVFLNATSLDSIYDDLLKKEISGTSKNLPLNVHLLTLEPLSETTILVRLEHIFEKDEDTEYSQPATVELAGLFKYFEIISLRETALAADRWLDEVDRLQWNVEDNVAKNIFLQDELNKVELRFRKAAFASDTKLENEINSEKNGGNFENLRRENGFQVVLKPMEIRTFVATIKRKTPFA